MDTLLSVKGLSKTYRQGRYFFNKQRVIALHDINFSIDAYKTIAIVGETAAGKSTLAKLLVGAESPSAGDIYLHGEILENDNLKERCKIIRMIFQDSSATLNPSLTVQQLLSEPLKLNTKLNETERSQHIADTLQKVGLLSDHMNFYPHMFSGGQKQRIAIARAIILNPKVIILDEALASLDPSLRSQMINLLLDLQENMGLAFILISHNLGIVKHFSDKIMVLKKGKIIEEGNTLDVLAKPTQKYTKKLIMSQQFQLFAK